MSKIVIIDYGLSNILSVKNAFVYLGADAIVSNRPHDILMSDKIVLPGVGAFEDGMNRLLALGLIDPIVSKVKNGTPLLGICLGMQMLFDESEEFGIHNGLGLIPGRVTRIPSIDVENNKQKVPHVSWGPLNSPNENDSFDSILQDVRVGEECYFIHSFEAKPSSSCYCLAQTYYGGRKICAAAYKDNVIGTQFHPEKSGEVGLKILKKYMDY